MLAIGDRVELELDRPAHGGFSVGRSDGQVVFVRHGIPGERVVVEVTEIGSGGRFARADVVEVLRASADRVEPRCPHAVPGGCGGCDWQHVELPRQRLMKAEIIREQLVRIGRLPATDDALTQLVVEACGDDVDGFGYRTRMDFVADARGRLGLRSVRSHDVIALRQCPLAVPEINAAEALRQPWQAGGTVRIARAASGLVVTPEGADSATVTERLDGETYEVAADGFWQVHRNAAAVFTQMASEMLHTRQGEFILDLYAGAGLFARVLADAVGPGGRIVAVEADRRAAKLAKRNLRAYPMASVAAARVDRWLAERSLAKVDAVILDPPRAGAGKRVMEEVARLRPSRVLYVACDPASLARDVAFARDSGYLLESLRAVDAFPHTGHVETFALLVAR